MDGWMDDAWGCCQTHHVQGLLAAAEGRLVVFQLRGGSVENLLLSVACWLMGLGYVGVSPPFPSTNHNNITITSRGLLLCLCPS